MIDLKLLRQSPEVIAASLAKRRAAVTLDRLIDVDQRIRVMGTEIDELRHKRNTASEAIGKLKQQGQPIEGVAQEMKAVSARIKELEESTRLLEEERSQLVLTIPNVLDSSVPDGADESANVEVRRWGEPRRFEFTPKSHDELGTALDWMDFEHAAKLVGSRFVVMKKWGARLERALGNMMLDRHTAHGYTEISPPYLANRETLTANGNLPKFEGDLFRVEPQDYFLIPTAEIPLTNLYRGEILEQDRLPMHLTAYTPCFRSEAGAAGRDTKGLIRQHQFSKCEMVKIVAPETSMDELEAMVKDAEAILQMLELPYRVVLLSSGDTGFNSAKTYDLEVWFPSQGKYREISSCSNCTDFQARRGQLRYRRDGQILNPHTLNGSGVAVGRALAALLENHQTAEGHIRIPKALRPYLDGREELS